MAEINFNVTDNSYPYDCLYFDTNYGYRACLNGKRLDIADIKTVIALKNQFGLPELNISEKDVKRFEKCIYWKYGSPFAKNGKEKDLINQSLFQSRFRDVV